VPTVVTFDPHPARVSPRTRARLIGTLDQRLEGFRALGIEQVRVLTFDRRLAAESAPDFVARVLAGELHAWEIVVGADFRFGRDRIGDVALLSAEGSVTASGSTRRRRSASRVGVRAPCARPRRRRRRFGERDTGSSFVLRGRVEHGDARGESSATRPPTSLPRRSKWCRSKVSTPERRGRRSHVAPGGDLYWHAPPVLRERPLLVEVHLPGFEGDLYDASLDVAFLARLRVRRSFPTWTRWWPRSDETSSKPWSYSRSSRVHLGTARIDIRSATLTMWVVTLATCDETSDS